MSRDILGHLSLHLYNLSHLSQTLSIVNGAWHRLTPFTRDVSSLHSVILIGSCPMHFHRIVYEILEKLVTPWLKLLLSIYLHMITFISLLRHFTLLTILTVVAWQLKFVLLCLRYLVASHFSGNTLTHIYHRPTSNFRQIKSAFGPIFQLRTLMLARPTLKI